MLDIIFSMYDRDIAVLIHAIHQPVLLIMISVYSGSVHKNNKFLLFHRITEHNVTYIISQKVKLNEPNDKNKLINNIFHKMSNVIEYINENTYYVT